MAGVSPILQALYQGQKAEALELARRADELDVFEAAALGRTGELQRRLSEAPATATDFSPDGFGALHLAAFFGHPEAVDLLLQAGADPNAEARNGTALRPLHSAVAGPAPMIAAALLAAGADPNAQQHGGWTALHAAAKHGNEKLVTLLLEAGADPGRENDDGSVAAEIARGEGHRALAALLRSRAGRPGTQPG